MNQIVALVIRLRLTTASDSVEVEPTLWTEGSPWQFVVRRTHDRKLICVSAHSIYVIVDAAKNKKVVAVQLEGHAAELKVIE